MSPGISKYSSEYKNYTQLRTTVWVVSNNEIRQGKTVKNIRTGRKEDKLSLFEMLWLYISKFLENL